MKYKDVRVTLTILIEEDVDRVRDANSAEGNYDGVHKSRHSYKIYFFWPVNRVQKMKRLY
jgi:hypothetical protein